MTPSRLIDVRPGEARKITSTDWLESRHSFSYGAHYDAGNTGFGPLVSCNEDVLAPAGGFSAHPHRNLEVVTWVLDGELLHEDDHGNRAVVRPGVVQRMSAGRGTVHSEVNASSEQPAHYVQMWITPDELGGAPSYQLEEVPEQTGLVPVASGRGHDGAAVLGCSTAVLWVVRGTVTLPVAPLVHVLVTRGSASLEDVGELQAGDAVRLTGAGALALTADEALVWELHS
ncbi:MAG: YhhW protein [Frankiales bacterium]|nr:YhhW protein [Frankiales bacterium]